jgi:type III secretion protein J
MISLKSLIGLVRLSVLALTVGVVLGGCSGRVELLAAIPEADANEVIAALINQGIDASKVPGKEGMVGVRVAGNQSARAVDVLRVLGLPRERFAGMGDVFRKDGLISSPIEERARYLYALSQDLSATLSRIDGVLFARVHLVLPERGSGGDPAMPASAAVFIKHRAEANLEALQPQVRRLVTNSIPGLSGERVSTVLVPSSVSMPPAPTGSASVLGVQIEPGSVGGFVALLVLCALIAAALAGGAVFWYVRRTAKLSSASSGNAPPAS